MALATKIQGLKEQLSEKATVDLCGEAAFGVNTARWSDFRAPTPGAVVNVMTEQDIACTHRVKFARQNHIPFTAQSGGHGCAAALQGVTREGIMINLRGLNDIKVDVRAQTATVGAGALTGDLLEAASAAEAHVVVGTCNSVGVLGSLLGGGLGTLSGLYGLGIDSFVSARLVTARGDVVAVSAAENAHLWWALRGAGHNFGIVSQLTVKVYPEVNGGVHWTGMLAFPGEKLRQIVDLLDAGLIKPDMSCTMVWARVPPAFQPMVVLNVWYAGSPEAAKAAFAPLYHLAPVMEQSAPTPYARTNDATAPFCTQGGRKTIFGAALVGLNSDKAVGAWKLWVDFTGKNEDAKMSALLIECYHYGKVREVPEMETAFPWRGCGFHLLDVVMYSDPKLDAEVQAHGNKLLAVMREGEPGKAVYVNFANGNERLEEIYGGEGRLQRLRALKGEWDPEGLFSHYYPIH